MNEPTQKLECVLFDEAVSAPKQSLRFAVEQWNGSYLLIRPEGYGEASALDGAGSPILIEFHNGKVQVIVWADINSEEPTHTIDLTGAKESNRKKE